MSGGLQYIAISIIKSLLQYIEFPDNHVMNLRVLLLEQPINQRPIAV